MINFVPIFTLQSKEISILENSQKRLGFLKNLRRGVSGQTNFFIKPIYGIFFSLKYSNYGDIFVGN